MSFTHSVRRRCVPDGYFADKHDVDRAYGSYEELAHDPDLDVVYVATPHGRHIEDVTTCLDAGKSVLCEKPLTGLLAIATFTCELDMY